MSSIKSPNTCYIYIYISIAPDSVILKAGEQGKSLLITDLPAGRQVTGPARGGVMRYGGWRKAKELPEGFYRIIEVSRSTGLPPDVSLHI